MMQVDRLVIQVDVVHPAGHAQQHLTHNREVTKVIRVDGDLGRYPIWQVIVVNGRIEQLDLGQNTIAAVKADGLQGIASLVSPL